MLVDFFTRSTSVRTIIYASHSTSSKDCGLVWTSFGLQLDKQRLEIYNHTIIIWLNEWLQSRIDNLLRRRCKVPACVVPMSLVLYIGTLPFQDYKVGGCKGWETMKAATKHPGRIPV